MIHFRQARATALEILRTQTEERQAIERAVIVDDVFGKIRALVWLAASHSPDFQSVFTELMKEKLEANWAGLIVASDASEADARLYLDVWNKAREITSSVRLSERIRSRGFWVNPPSNPAWSVREGYPPVVAFYSYKGGVGRTTVLSSFAVQRARLGDTVVVIDLDLDAPGVGTLLASGVPDELGVVDYLIESPLHPQLDLSDYYHYCLGSSSPPVLAGTGQIIVFPAGRIDADYLAMLARLDLEPTASEGNHPLLRMLEQTRKELSPDWILIDSRAGLSEASGFALSGLANLTVLLGTPSIQSWHGLRLVVERLGAERLRLGLPQAECLVVQTMTPENSDTADSAKLAFREEAEDAFEAVYYAEDPIDEDDESFWYVRDMESDDAPHQPSVLSYSQKYAFIRSIDDVADNLAEDAEYARLGYRIASRFGKEPE